MDNGFTNISVNEQGQFTQTIQNMISNYTSPDAITCDDRNLPWIGEKIKKKDFIKIVTILRSLEIRNTGLFDKFQSPEAHFKSTFDESKQKYYSRLSDKL